jgi:ADP-heptose:LPS heptosyltransferase
MLKLVTKKRQPITLREHFERRNKVLVKRREGGVGDHIMIRMIFEDFRRFMEEIDLYFGCTKSMLSFVSDHPFATAVALDDTNDRQFGAVYDISTACRVHETMQGIRNIMHRSDIWAKHCGIHLTNHNTFLQAADPVYYRTILCQKNIEKKPTILFTPYSTPNDMGLGKSLTEKQILQIIPNLREMGFWIFSTNKQRDSLLDSIGVEQFNGLRAQDWIGLTSAADYVVSVDTATFHIAGALKKPLVGIFSFTNGKVYGKYYDFVLVQKHKDNGDWDCGPCFCFDRCPKSKMPYKPCMTEIKIEDIIAGIRQAVDRWPLVSRPSTKSVPPQILEIIAETTSYPLANEDCRSLEQSP